MSGVDDVLQAVGRGPSASVAHREYRCDGCLAPLIDRRAWLSGAGLCETCGAIRREHERGERLRAALSTIPARFRDAIFCTDVIKRRVQSQLARVKAERAIGRLVVTICGPTGGGKTTLACAMMNHILGSEDPALRVLARSARFMVVYDLAEARSQHGLGDGEAPLVAMAKRASFLVLDDVGKEPSRRRDIVAEVIHSRTAANLDTVITTELDQSAVFRLYTTDECSGAYLQRRMFAPPAVVIDVAQGAP
jgi:DNA replication protein DnaC